MDAFDESERLAERQAELFESGARNADNLAETYEASAILREEMGRPGGAEHAERDHQLAAAERASAEALREHRLPPDEARDTIRNG